MASRLRSAGVVEGSRVAVLLDRAPEGVVAMLAIWSIGAIHAAIDPTLPTARRDHVLADMGPACVIVDTDRAHELPTDRCLLIDQPLEATVAEAKPWAPAGGSSPAYLLYTSGSTGRPKGVLVGHASLGNLVRSFSLRMDFTADTVTTVVSRTSFDLSLAEILCTLLTGGHVVMLTTSQARDPAAFAAVSARHSANTVLSTPTHLRGILATLPDTISGWTVGVGAEMVPTHVAEELDAVAAKVVNCYGPTEATVWSTTADITAGDMPPSIGVPLDNQRALVLDGRLRQVPIGVVGQIYLAGDGLALGYDHMPGFTSAHFLANPHGPPGSRMYRTGDLGRWTGSGRLQCLGRADDQVKIRGFRIELGDVRAALSSHGDVRDAMVVTHTSPTGENVLSSFVIVRSPEVNEEETTAALRTHVAQHVPEYMVPAVIAVVDEFPVNANGKVDLGRLRRMSSQNWSGRKASPGAERLVARSMARLVDRDEVGADDNFFTVGGNSFSAVLLAHDLGQQTESQVSVRLVFESPTPATLARRLGPPDRFSGHSRGLANPIRLRTQGTGHHLVLLPPVNGLGWGYSSLTRVLPDGHPVTALQDPRHGETLMVRHDFPALVQCYREQVEQLRLEGPLVLGGWSYGGLLGLGLADLLTRQDPSAVAHVVLFDTHAPTNRGPKGAMHDDVLAAALDGAVDPRFDDLSAELVLHRLRAVGSPLGDLDRVQVERLVEISQANILALESWSEPRVACPVMAFEATADRAPGLPPLTRQWAPVLQGPLQVHAVAATHARVATAEALADHTAELRDALREPFTSIPLTPEDLS